MVVSPSGDHAGPSGGGFGAGSEYGAGLPSTWPARAPARGAQPKRRSCPCGWLRWVLVAFGGSIFGVFLAFSVVSSLWEAGQSFLFALLLGLLMFPVSIILSVRAIWYRHNSKCISFALLVSAAMLVRSMLVAAPCQSIQSIVH